MMLSSEGGFCIRLVGLPLINNLALDWILLAIGDRDAIAPIKFLGKLVVAILFQ